jgi:RNA polymerase sigma-70 factor, ECF subfamily
MTDRRCNDDEHRFAQWFHEHGGAVRGYLWASVRRQDVVEELIQEVFCRAWQARATYREQGNARAYLLRIADRLVCDFGRRNGSQVNLDRDGWIRHEPIQEGCDPASAAALAEENSALTAALDQLSPPQRRVLLLRYYGQFRFSEIAEMTGSPLNTTLSHCRRGLEALRTLLGEKAGVNGTR